MKAVPANSNQPADLALRVLRWYDRHGRHDLPWQRPRNAYRVWLAEIMLQQTQVGTVIPYFERFLARFPDLPTLAAASLDEVLELWSGLGYYARARNLHRAAGQICQEHGGEFPREFPAVSALAGIGRSTAGAILAQAFGQRHPILDGNVKRVLARYHAICGWPGDKDVAVQLWHMAEKHLPQRRLADYTQAMMDLGATLCRRRNPNCAACPLRAGCRAYALGRAHDFPAARPRRIRPQRQTRMLLIERGDKAVLLLRRPPAGIWGGLWSLPELPAGRGVAAYCKSEFGYAGELVERLPRIEHGFTHFDLNIQPLRVALQDAADGVREAGSMRWYKTGEALPGVPTPVRRLLLSCHAARNEQSKVTA